MSFSVDGITWEYPCQIERTAEIQASDLSGLMLNLDYFNDVQGIWMEYDVTIAVPFGSEDDYYTIYETLTQPVDGHLFVLPYNNSEITVTARVLSVADALVRMPEGKNYWKGTTFKIVANHPSKFYSLSEVLVRGRTPLPDVASVEEGTTYVYTTASGWVPAPTYEDGEVMYF